MNVAGEEDWASHLQAQMDQLAAASYRAADDDVWVHEKVLNSQTDFLVRRWTAETYAEEVNDQSTAFRRVAQTREQTDLLMLDRPRVDVQALRRRVDRLYGSLGVEISAMQDERERLARDHAERWSELDQSVRERETWAHDELDLYAEDRYRRSDQVISQQVQHEHDVVASDEFDR